MSENKERVNQIPVNPPDDLTKPFFTYGVFKKGQIAHSKIAPYVEWVDDAEDVEIRDCMLRMRDGIPLILDEKSSGYNTKGQIIHFCEGYEEDAYMAISNTEPDDLYQWGETIVKGVKVNLLYGKLLDDDENPYGGIFMYGNDGDIYKDDFDGGQDLFFKDLIEFLQDEYKNIVFDDYGYFRIQMCYMILWSAIDRYCSLKYDSVDFQGDDIRNMSEDPVFIESIDECNLKYHKPIYSTKTGKPWKWKNSPYSKLYYYYRLRGNVVHRGKDRMTNTGVLYDCLNELLRVFDKAIKKTFNGNDNSI